MAEHGHDIRGEQNPPSAEQPVCKKEENIEPQLGDASGEDNEDDGNNPDEDDDDVRPSCSFNSEHDEEFEPDRLSLVQSKLLEDWRPDLEAPQCDQSGNANAGPSRSLGKKSASSFCPCLRVPCDISHFFGLVCYVLKSFYCTASTDERSTTAVED